MFCFFFLFCPTADGFAWSMLFFFAQLQSEPAPPEKTELVAGYAFTLWDKWEIRGRDELTVQQFLDTFEVRYSLRPSGIFVGSSVVYVPLFPGHAKRLVKPIKKFLKFKAGQQYNDLTVTFAKSPDVQEEVAGPPVRYFF